MAPRTFRNRLLIPGLILIALFLGQQAAPVAASCGGATNVANQTQLNAAIAAFNSQAGPCTFGITLAADILLTASTTAISNNTAGVSLVIDGAGFTVDGQDLSGVRPFDVAAGTVVTLDAITITGGNNDFVANGGGIRNNFGMLTVSNSTIEGNKAAAGGGILNEGTLHLINSTVRNNSNNGTGGGVYNQGGTATISGSTLSGNTSAVKGAGLHNLNGTVTISNSTLSGNTAGTNGGGIGNEGGAVTVINSTLSGNRANVGSGGGIYMTEGLITLKNSIVANSPSGGDCAVTGGGTLDAQNTLLEDGLGCVNGSSSNNLTGDPGLGPLQNNGGRTETHALALESKAVDAGSNALAVDVDGSTPLSSDQRGAHFPRVIDGTVDLGAYELDCGFPRSAGTAGDLSRSILCFNLMTTAGTYVLSLSDDIPLAASTETIDNATAGATLVIDGAGHAVDGQGQARVRPFEIAADTTVTMRALTITGGNADSVSRFGGGVLNFGTLTVDSSTIVGNVAYSFGAGILNAGTLHVNNSTFVDNDDNGGLLGVGALFNSGQTAVLEINNSTITSNSLGVYNSQGTLTISNSIVKGNDFDRECTNSGGTADLDHTFTSPGSFGCGPSSDNGNVFGTDPLLGPLQDNGGPTETMMLGAGSNAISAGDNATCEAADQRGVPRPQGATCDMGAVEFTGQAALSGVVELQGRPQPGTPGTVTISDAAAIMPDTAVPFDATTGAFSFGSVPVASGGTSYDVTAVHGLYLANQLAGQAAAAAANLDLGTTELRGGDANNDGTINILDLGCMGADYNQAPGTCGGAGGTDINNDGITNISDLAIVGGNYNLTAPQPWSS